MDTPIPNKDTRDAMEMLNISESTLRRMIKSGELKTVKVRGRYRTTEEWINQVVAPVEPAFQKTQKDKAHRDRKVKTNQQKTKPSDAVDKLCATFGLRPKKVHDSGL